MIQKVQPAAEIMEMETPVSERWTFLGADVLRFGTILGLGGGLALWAAEDENPDATRDDLEDIPVLDLPAEVGNWYGGGWVVGAGSLSVYAVGQASGHQKTADLGYDLTKSYLISGVLVKTLKITIDRKRPSGGPWSFPSGHTTAAFSSVPIIWHHLGWKAGLPVTLLASGTAVGRLKEYRHYISDVIFGAALGLAVGDAIVQSRLAEHLVIAPDGVGVQFGF